MLFTGKHENLAIERGAMKIASISEGIPLINDNTVYSQKIEIITYRGHL
jgi:hypothetical protein